MKLVSVLSRGRMDDDGPVLPVTTDFLHAEAVAPQPPPSLIGTQVDVEAVAFDFDHGF